MFVMFFAQSVRFEIMFKMSDMLLDCTLPDINKKIK
jgi:hypothetical protein